MILKEVSLHLRVPTSQPAVAELGIATRTVFKKKYILICVL